PFATRNHGPMVPEGCVARDAHRTYPMRRSPRRSSKEKEAVSHFGPLERQKDVMPRGLIGIALVAAWVSSVGGGCAGTIEGSPTGAAGNGGPPGGAMGDLLPARIRRLTNAEYDASVQALLGTKQALAATTFPPDARQGGFTVNDAQRVDPVLAKQLASAAETLAGEAAANGTLARLAPCADPVAGGATCAKDFIQSFGAAAYRRPLTGDEVAAMQALYAAGAEGATYADGIALVVRGVLQAPGFLYLTEL